MVEVRREWGALPWALSSEPEPGSLLGELSLRLLTEDLDSHLGLGASALCLASRTAPVTARMVSVASPFHASAPLFQNK